MSSKTLTRDEYSVEEPRRVKRRNIFIQALRAMFVWYPKNYPEDERRLLFKLDLAILIYGSVSYFVKTLDQTNISNAYISGMKEDLGMYGNELNWLNITYWQGYVLGQLPLLLLISRPRISKFVLPGLEVIYGVLTILQSQAKTVKHIYVLRFFIGVFDAPLFIGVHYILGRWYGAKSYRGNPAELFVRTGTWFLCLPLGNMFSGYLQTAAYKNLSGVQGYKGWQWLFMIDGIMTLPISILGFITWPGLPESEKPWYLNDKDYEIVQKRLKRYKVVKAGKLDKHAFKRTFSQWKWYTYVILYIALLLSSYPTSYFSLWLKAQGTYTVPQLNDYPTVTSALTVISSFIGTALSAVISPWKIFTTNIICLTIGEIILTIYHVPTGAVFFAFYICGITGSLSPIFFSSINRALKHDQEQKAIVMGSVMSIGYFVYTWAPLGLFPTDTKYGKNAAPQWKTGWPTSLGFTIFLGAGFFVARYLENRDRRLRGEGSIEADQFVDITSDDDENETLELGETTAALGTSNSNEKDRIKIVSDEVI